MTTVGRIVVFTMVIGIAGLPTEPESKKKHVPATGKKAITRPVTKGSRLTGPASAPATQPTTAPATKPADKKVAELIQKLKGKDEKVRADAARALAKMGAAAGAAVPALIGALKDKEFKVRMWATDALGKIGPDAEQAVRALTDQFRDRKGDDLLRLGAAVALTRIGGIGVGIVIEALKDPNKDVRIEAASALGLAGPPARHALPALVRALKDEYSVVRLAAAEALGETGPAAMAAVPALTEALEDEDEEVREAARAALRQIRGEKEPPTRPTRRADKD